MFSRFRVRNTSDMKLCIFSFLSAVLGEDISSSIYIKSSSGSHFFYIMNENYGISAWAVDAKDHNVSYSQDLSPYTATSTVGVAAKYVKDLVVSVVDYVATQKEIDRLLEELADREYAEYGGKYDEVWTDARDKLNKKLKHDNDVREIMNTKVYKKVFERVYGTNVFHVGGSLKFDEVITSLPYKVLDCHYNDNTFMFNLFSEDLPNMTRTLTFGELHDYDNLNKDSCFIMSNTFHLVSETKNTGYGDAFVGSDGTEEPIYGDTKIINYCPEILRMVQIDVDNEPIPMKYSVNGNEVGIRLNLAPRYLTKFNMDKEHDGNPLGKFSGNNYKLIEWYHRELHCSYEAEKSDVGVNYFPLQNPAGIKEYEIYDNYAKHHKKFSGFRRSGTGGNSVNTKNNISELMPVIFYVLRDPDDLDSWSAVGESVVVNFVNMYNMGTGRTMQSKYLNDYNKATCYNLYIRRPPYTPFNEDYNDIDNQYTDSYGFGGTTGIAFKDCTEGSNSLLIGREYHSA